MSVGFDDGSGRGASGQMVRYVIGLVIALVGIGMYYLRTEVNPVTGEKQHVNMSVDQEKALGLQAAPQMADQMGGAIDPDQDPRARMVADVGRRIVERSDASRSPYVGNFHFYLLKDTKTINAFALPGGQIFITRALYDKLQNEAQLAGVLGHEVGHVIHRHGAEHMATGQLGQAVATAVGVGASDGSSGGQMAAAAAQMANNMVQLKYGRADELESDSYGIQLMMQLGYDPAEMIGVMEILKSAGGGGGQPQIMASHPHPEARIEQIHQILAKYKDDLAKMRLTKGERLP